PALDILPDVSDHLGQGRVFRLGRQDLQALYQWKSGVDHGGKLTCENSQVFLFDAGCKKGPDRQAAFRLDRGYQNILFAKKGDHLFAGFRADLTLSSYTLSCSTRPRKGRHGFSPIGLSAALAPEPALQDLRPP